MFRCSEAFVIIYHVFVNVHGFSSQSAVTLRLLEKLKVMARPHVSGLTCPALSSVLFSATLVLLSSPFIQDHDHCWKLGAIEQLCGERAMRTGHSGMSPST